MLLITRGLVEAIAPAGDVTEFELNIRRGLENLLEINQITGNAYYPITEDVLETLFDTIQSSSEGFMEFSTILTRISRELEIISNCVNGFIDRNWDDAEANPELREFGLTRNIEDLLKLLKPLESIRNGR